MAPKAHIESKGTSSSPMSESPILALRSPPECDMPGVLPAGETPADGPAGAEEKLCSVLMDNGGGAIAFTADPGGAEVAFVAKEFLREGAVRLKRLPIGSWRAVGDIVCGIGMAGCSGFFERNS